MEPENLIQICTIAFASVFGLLSFLAIAMKVITAVFPETVKVLHPAVVAAISSTVATLLPGSTVSKIEEER